MSALFFYGESLAYTCDFLPEKPAPSWVEKRPEIPEYYVGIGTADMREKVEEQIESSQQNALVNLGKDITVTVQSTFLETVSTDESDKIRQEVEAVTETKVLELLRGAKIREKWLDRKNCVLWTLAVVSRESVLAVQKELEEQIRRKFTSKQLMLFALARPENPNETEQRVISAFEKTVREMGVKVVMSHAKYLPCAKGDYSKMCDEKEETIFGGFDIAFDKEKLSDDGTLKARFFKFSGALYFKDRRVTAFNVSCRGVGNAVEKDAVINLSAADACVSAIKKRLGTDMQASE